MNRRAFFGALFGIPAIAATAASMPDQEGNKLTKTIMTAPNGKKLKITWIPPETCQCNKRKKGAFSLPCQHTGTFNFHAD